MAAFVEHRFTKGFLLDEERLRKLREIIEKRSSPALVSYRVFRGDSYSYVTQVIDDVAKEDNEDWKRITRLELLVTNGERLTFQLIFTSKGCELRITGSERDEVFLLFTDLRDYIQHEVSNVRKGPSNQTVRTISNICMMIFMMVAFWRIAVHGKHDPAAIKQVVSVSDLRTKLDFLIQDLEKRDEPPGMLLSLIAGFSVIVFLGDGIAQLPAYLNPANEFLFGKRKQSFEKRQRLVARVVWGIGVGLIVSIVAGLIVWAMTRDRRVTHLHQSVQIECALNS
jgi:hypothetical protein